MEDSVSRASIDKIMARGRALRYRLATTAATIATTEDQMADTLERMADSRPRDADRLLARAAHARSFAAAERVRAADYGQADGHPGGPPA